MIEEEKFKSIQFIRELIIYLDNMLEGFPKKDLEIKRTIKEESYNMLKIAYLANVTTDLKIRRENLEKILVSAKLIDFLVNLSYDKKIINQKKYLKVGQRIDDIVKYVTGWIKVTIEESNKKQIHQGIIDGWLLAASIPIQAIATSMFAT